MVTGFVWFEGRPICEDAKKISVQVVRHAPLND